VSNLGFPMGKDKMVIADLSGIFLSADRRIKIKSNMEVYWDQVFFSEAKDLLNDDLSERSKTSIN